MWPLILFVVVFGIMIAFLVVVVILLFKHETKPDETQEKTTGQQAVFSPYDREEILGHMDRIDCGDGGLSPPPFPYK